MRLLKLCFFISKTVLCQFRELSSNFEHTVVGLDNLVGGNWKGTAVESTAGFEEGSKKRGTVTVEGLGIVEAVE